MLKIAFAAILIAIVTPAAGCAIDVRGSGYAMINVWAQPNRGLCDVQSFPKPWNTLLGMKQGASRAFFWNYEKEQAAYVMFQINKKGSGRVIFHYTNDKVTDGDTFVSTITLLDSKKRVIGYIGSQRGVNARSTGDDIKALRQSPDFWSRVRYLQFSHGYADKWDDEKIGKAAKAAASAISCGYFGVCLP